MRRSFWIQFTLLLLFDFLVPIWLLLSSVLLKLILLKQLENSNEED